MRVEFVSSALFKIEELKALLAGAEALERLEAMESSSSTMLPKSASVSEEQ